MSLKRARKSPEEAASAIYRNTMVQNTNALTVSESENATSRYPASRERERVVSKSWNKSTSLLRSRARFVPLTLLLPTPHTVVTFPAGHATTKARTRTPLFCQGKGAGAHP